MPKVSENKDKMVTFRMNEDDFNLLKVCALVTGQSRPNGEPNVGEYIRFVLRMSIAPMKMELRKRGLSSNEAYECVCSGDDFLQHK